MEPGTRAVYDGKPCTIIAYGENPGTLIKYDDPKYGYRWGNYGTRCNGESCEDEDWCDCRALATGLIKPDDTYDWAPDDQVNPAKPLNYVNA